MNTKRCSQNPTKVIKKFCPQTAVQQFSALRAEKGRNAAIKYNIVLLGRSKMIKCSCNYEWEQIHNDEVDYYCS